MEKTTLKPYSYYKPSGVEWLGAIPVNWGMERAKWLFTKEERPIREQDDIITCFRDGVVTLRKNRRELGFTESLKEIGYQGIRRGDLVIHSMDAFAGAIGVSDSDGKGTPVYSVCKPSSVVNAHYYAYILREMARNEWIIALAKGIRQRSSDFRYTDFGRQYLPLPPLDEQTAIVRYLDHADERIQRAISAKERLIELLTEQRQAVIHQAVTRGLDPNVRLKDSGVEWLGDVPAHWEVRRLRNVVDMRVSNVDKHVKDTESPVRLCNYIDVYKNERINAELTFMQATATTNEIDRFRLKIRDVIITKDSETWNDIGIPALVDYAASDLICGYHLAILRPQHSSLDGRFLFRVLQSSTVGSQFHVSASGVTRFGLTHEAIKSALLPLPPLNEQAAIAHHLNKATADIDAGLDNAQRQINLLREYRTRLIADVVTGKLKVEDQP